MKHPELKDDEYFIGHYTPEEFSRVSWKTKRAGFTEQDSFTPVFVKRSEVKEVFGKHIESFIAGLSDEEKALNGIIVCKKNNN